MQEVKIHFGTPFAPDKNLARAYNEFCDLMPDGDWICLTDADTMWIPSAVDYHDLMQKAIAEYPDTGLFGCMTNRVGKLYQCHNNIISKSADLLYHESVMIERAERYGHQCEEVSHISGFMMLFPKNVWKEVGGFDEKHIDKQGKVMLEVDNTFSFMIGIKRPVRVIQGLHIIHYYRLKQGIFDKSHLK